MGESALGIALKGISRALVFGALLSCAGSPKPVRSNEKVEVLPASAYASYLHAQVAAYEGHPLLAIEHLRQAKGVAPNEAPIRLELVKYLQVVGNYTDALEEISTAQKRWPKNSAVWIRAGDLARTLKRDVAAVAAYKRATSLGDNSEQLAVSYALVLTKLQHFDVARETLKKALDVHAESSELIYERAKLDYQHPKGAGSIPLAITSLQLLVNREPYATNAWALLALCYFAQGKMDAGNDALRSPFDRSEGQFWVADSLFDTLIDLERPMSERRHTPSARLDKILDRSDLLLDTRISMVHWQLRLGNFAYALERANLLAPIDKGNAAIAELQARALTGMRRSKEANIVLKKITNDSKSYPLMRAMLARLVVKNGKVEDARKIISDALEEYPEDAELNFAKASVEELAGHPEAARQVLLAILKRFPSSKRARYDLAQLETRQGRNDAAIAAIVPLVQANPLDADALNFIGYALLKLPTERKRARLLLLRALNLAPDNPYILDSYGWLLFHEGDYKAAFPYLQRGVRLTPAEPEALLHLAELHWRMGKRAEANETLFRAIRFAHDPVLRRKIQTRQRVLNAQP